MDALKTDPEFSIVIPTYNRALLLPRGRFHTVINECPVLLGGFLRMQPAETWAEPGEEARK